MSEKTITEREAVLRERAAYVRGYLQASGHMSEVRPVFLEYVETVARSAYPHPKVTRPRCVADPEGDGFWFVRDGRLLWTTASKAIGGVDLTINSDLRRPVTPERARLWSALFANPTEEVEA